MEAALERLTRESKTPELRTMCLQVVSTTTTFRILHPCTHFFSYLSYFCSLSTLLFRPSSCFGLPSSYPSLLSLLFLSLSLPPFPLPPSSHFPQVIAVLYYNPSMLLGLLEKTHFPDSTEAITTQFFSQWIKDADLFMG